MELEKIVRFKFEFMECDSLTNLKEQCKRLIKMIDKYKKLDIDYYNFGDDYHTFTIKTTNEPLIKKLLKEGFNYA